MLKNLCLYKILIFGKNYCKGSDDDIYKSQPKQFKYIKFWVYFYYKIFSEFNTSYQKYKGIVIS